MNMVIKIPTFIAVHTAWHTMGTMSHSWLFTTEFWLTFLCFCTRQINNLNTLNLTLHQSLAFSPMTKKKHPLKISSLDVSHTEVLDWHLPYGGTQERVSHVRACIRHLPNVCVTDNREQPVSWMLSDKLCELRIAYTSPEYRRAGHLMALSAALVRKVSTMGLPVLLSRQLGEPSRHDRRDITGILQVSLDGKYISVAYMQG